MGQSMTKEATQEIKQISAPPPSYFCMRGGCESALLLLSFSVASD